MEGSAWFGEKSIYGIYEGDGLKAQLVLVIGS